MRVYVPVCKFRDDNGNIREQHIWSMTEDAEGTMSKTQVEVWFAQFNDAWAETYADMGYEMLSMRIAEFQEI